MFPDGWPGAGLFLLRAAVATVLFMQSGACFSHQNEHGFLMAAAVFVMSADPVQMGLVASLSRPAEMRLASRFFKTNSRPNA